MSRFVTVLRRFYLSHGNRQGLKAVVCLQDYTKEERAGMAAKSREQPPQFGNSERQAVTNEIHAAMLAAEEAQVLVPFSRSTFSAIN